MVEFTGERVVPGQVNADLWSEHLARYAFARRFTAGKRVLDAGCGTGYGAAELSQEAASVVGVDLAPDAARHARDTYTVSNITFGAASCESLPFAAGSFDVVTGFEVIEHLTGYREFIREVARVLTPPGLFIVSTPNRRYYTESRGHTGPNPYHHHEFEAEEFRRELSAVFENVCVLLQNRVESFAFYPHKQFWPADAVIDNSAGNEDEAHFLIAVCSNAPLPEMRSFVYVTRAVNLLREREQHLRLLETELDQTQQWLDAMTRERNELLDLFRKQKLELEARNAWAEQLGRQLAESNERVVDLQDELAREQAAGREVAAGYDSKVRELEAENAEKTRWALDTEAHLSAELEQRTADLAEFARLLETAEATVEERTLWAQRADTERERLAAVLNGVRASRWLKLGKLVRLGPVLREP